MKVLGFSSCCPYSHIDFFPLPGLILRRCILDEEGIAYWEPPTYIKCVSIDYRNIQMMVRQTDFSAQRVWRPPRCLLHCYSYKTKKGNQHFHVKGRCQLCPAFLLLFLLYLWCTGTPWTRDGSSLGILIPSLAESRSYQIFPITLSVRIFVIVSLLNKPLIFR